MSLNDREKCAIIESPPERCKRQIDRTENAVLVHPYDKGLHARYQEPLPDIYLRFMDKQGAFCKIAIALNAERKFPSERQKNIGDFFLRSLLD